MLEIEAKRVLLARAVEEREPGLLLPETLAAARDAAGPPDDGPAWLVRRAAYLVDRLAPDLQALTRSSVPPIAAWLGFPLIAFVFGFASSPLGPSQRIHAFINPITALIVWNGFLFIAMFGGSIARRFQAAAPRSPAIAITGPLESTVRSAGWIGRVLLSVVRFVRRLTGTSPRSAEDDDLAQASRLRSAGRRFYGLYAGTCADPIRSRARAILSLSAIAVACGALLGMYIRGVAYGYNAAWESTLVESGESRLALLRAVFFPAVLMLGQRFPGPDDVSRLATDEGAPAAIWLHIYAICSVAYILVPRLAIAGYNTVKAWRQAAHVELDLTDTYWRDVLEPPPSGDFHSLERSVLGAFALDANATTVLASCQAGMVEDDVRETTTGGMRFRDTLGDKKDWYRKWTKLWERRFEEFPSEGRPQIVPLDSPEFGRAVDQLPGGPNPYSAELILLELAAFTAYWPLESEKPGMLSRFRPSLSIDASIKKKALQQAALKLGAAENTATDLGADLERTLRSLSRFWLRLGVSAAGGVALGALTFGIAAPLIGSVLGSVMGLSGAAAVNAGLAAIGFGALSLGGLGMSGGTTILVGGGALLGLIGGGGAVAMSQSLTAQSALVLATKIDVVLRRIVVERHDDWAEYRAIVEKLEEATEGFRKTVPEMKLSEGVTTRQIRDWERSLEVLDKTLARCHAWEEERKPPPAR